LGHFHTERVNVAFWSGESGAVTVRETALRIAGSKGIDLARCSIDWGFTLPKLSDLSHLAALAEIIRDKKYEVVLIDPLYLALLTADAGGKSSDLFFMGSILQPLSEIGQATGCTLILLHHFRKNSQADESEPASLEELAQSGAAEWCRQWLLLQRRSPYQQDGRHELWLRCGGSAGHAGLYGVDIEEGILDPDTFSGRRWDVAVRTIADTRNEIRQEKEGRKAAEMERREGEHVERVLGAVRKYPSGETEKVLRSAARINQDSFVRAALTLEKDGRIEQCEVKKPRGTYAGWKSKSRR
jgi:hypothetical protein